MPLEETKDKFGLAVRAGLSILLIGAFAYHIGSAGILAQMKAVRWETMALVVLVLAANVLVVTPRWSTILGALGYPIPSSALITTVFVGFLFNQLLPTGVGGDVLRAWRARDLGVPLQHAIHSVLIDRAAGVFAALMGTVTLLPFIHLAAGRGLLLSMIAIATAAGLGACVVLWAVGLVEVDRLPAIGRLHRLILGVRSSIGLLVRKPMTAFAVLALACANQLLPITAIWLLANQMDIRVALLDLAFITFVSTLAATIPISFAGWGIREGALVFLFGLYSIPAEAAFALSVLYGAALVVSAGPGALLLLYQVITGQISR